MTANNPKIRRWGFMVSEKTNKKGGENSWQQKK